MNRLGTKSETLHSLYQKLKYAEVLPQYTFTVGEWRTDSEKVIKGFLAAEWNEKVIVRSSSLLEDTSQNSQAGKYESVAGVTGVKEFSDAVDEVIGSYDDDNEANQVLVQPMLSDVSICGVAFTVDPNTLGNYYVINYDDHGSTSAITSGNGAESKLYYRFKEKNLGRSERVSEKDDEEASRNLMPADRMEQLCLALRELEIFFDQENLDVEFAFSKEKGVLYIFQVWAL